MQVSVYVFMALVIFVVVSLITFNMLGYRIDKGHIKQTAFLQYNTTPSGATVTVDGKPVSSKTPNKSQIEAGKHEIIMWRDGYKSWKKSVDIKAGTLTWLNYAILVPNKLPVEQVLSYDSLYFSLASPNGKYIILQKSASVPSFDLVDIGSDKIKSTNLTLSSDLYSESMTAGINHSFEIAKWDDGGRYILINHKFNDKNEWLVVDTQDVKLSKNITRIFDVSINHIVFSGTSGNIFYILTANDVRKLDLANGTISKPFISNVTEFDIYNDSKVIAYVSNGRAEIGERIVGIYRDGDDSASVIRSIQNSKDISLHIASSRYFNQNYLAISEGKRVDILSGSYPVAGSDSANTMKTISSFMSEQDVKQLSFSPTGEYVFVQSDAYFTSYDLEYQNFTASTIEGNGPITPLKWLDHNYIWSDRDGKLTIREFDGTNISTINSVVAGHGVTLTENGRYIYSINKLNNLYQLQRVRMILP